MDENTIKPLGDIVVIKVDPPQKQTESGIIIKEDWKSLPPTGVVISMGKSVPDTVPIYAGSRVVFERYSAVMLSDDLRLCRAENVLAVVEDALQSE